MRRRRAWAPAVVPPNFEHFVTGFKARRYKRLGRSQVFNAALTPAQLLQVFSECFESLKAQVS